MTDRSKEDPASFSLVRGGPFHRLGLRLGVVRGDNQGLLTRSLALVGITFLPLVVLAALQGVLVGPVVVVPLAVDLSVYARFVIAISLLVFAERTIDRRLSEAVGHFRTSGLLEGRAREDFEAAIGKLERTRDSLLPEIVLLLLAFVLAWVSSRAVLTLPVSSWRALTPGLESSTTWAGAWLERVSLPFYQFMIYRWLWRILVWSTFLARAARCDLRLVPTHPDGAAGLGFLGGAQASFSAFLVPMALTAASRGVQWVQVGGGTMDGLRNSLIAFVVLALALVLGPLLLFMPKLAAIKRRGLYEYGTLATDYTRRFDQKWVRGRPAGDEPLLGTADIQSLADLNNSFDVIRRMRLVPPNLQNTISLLLAATLPMLPFIALIVPIQQILRQLAGFVMR